MTLFYSKALEDKLLGPFFIHELGDDMQSEEWVDHIDLLADFWLSELNGENTYIGNYIGAHIKVSHITQESFVIWLKLFSQAVNKVYTQDIAEQFKDRGILLAKEFQQVLKIKGKEWIQTKRKTYSS
ncbi:MAG: globin [Sulfurimonas sp.]|nr:MAG: globin [Sulfurimonas sp.]